MSLEAFIILPNVISLHKTVFWFAKVKIIFELPKWKLLIYNTIKLNIILII